MVKISIRELSAWLLFAFMVLMVFAFFCSSPDETDLGKGFVYFGDHNSHIYYWGEGDSTTVFIPPEVLSYYNTTDYFLVKQHPHQYDKAGDPRFYEYLYGRDSVYFWYVDKNTKDYVGPLLYSEIEEYLQRNGIDYMLQKLN